ncbi:unnamed protein product [Rotaria socialis]|uniref:Uncharacterized protein n=1 Tax=Rotaria socialis TaxID=392032 RepID=A0A820X8N2_9BILA|nr:unnamed protein product [Rotaria socialis]CAF4529386.1 unnamed protein product [Rotaria socialis]CAF4653915.1 unnamed protein product [Rotaria socialis]CAF4868653.1 unnamed protein product [Rotaria socialis]
MSNYQHPAADNYNSRTTSSRHIRRQQKNRMRSDLGYVPRSKTVGTWCGSGHRHKTLDMLEGTGRKMAPISQNHFRALELKGNKRNPVIVDLELNGNFNLYYKVSVLLWHNDKSRPVWNLFINVHLCLKDQRRSSV